MAVYLFENWPFSSIPLPMAGYSIDLPKGRAQNSSRAQSFMFFRCRKSHQVMSFGASYLRPDWGLLPEPETRSERSWDSLDTTMRKGRSEVCAESENVETEADRKNGERMSKKMCMPKVLGTNYFTELSKTVLRFWESILSGSITHKPIKITATQAISFL